MATLGDRLYAVGGWSSLEPLEASSVVESFCFHTDSWRLEPPLPRALGSVSVCAADGRLFVCGGSDGSTALNCVYSFDPLDCRWQEEPPMHQARCEGAVVESGGRLAVMQAVCGCVCARAR